MVIVLTRTVSHVKLPTKPDTLNGFGSIGMCVEEPFAS